MQDIRRNEKVKYGRDFEFFSFERPWGWQEVICENANSITVKVVHVNKNEMLSLQRHKNRDQLYIPMDSMQVQYEAADSMIITVDVSPPDKIYLPRGTLHRVINNTDKETVCFTEVCWGTNDESDITRVADKYSRGDG